MRALWLIIPAVMLAGCDFGLRTCSTDDDCLALNATCDMATGFCVREPLDSGMATGGGGATVGGGGGMTGGGATGGGATGGGSGGGTPTGGGGMMTGGGSTGGGGVTGGGGGAPMCPPCATGNECITSTGTCAPVALVLVSSGLPGTVGLTSQTVNAEIRRADGGSLVGVVLPDLNTVTLMAGAGGAITVPAIPTVVSSPSFSFPVRASAEGLVTSTNVDMAVDTDAGVVRGSVPINVDSSPSIVKVELAELHPVGNRGSEWDISAASLEGAAVTPATPRRDDWVVLRASSRDAFSARPRLFAGSGAGAVEAPLVSCPVACDAGACECYSLELWKFPFPQVSGVVPLRVIGTNARGVGFDGGVSVDGGEPGVAMTRVRWIARPDSQGPALRVTPAIDTDGNLFFGTQLTSSVGKLLALNANGTTAGSWLALPPDVGAVTSVALEPDAGLVYFSASDSAGAYVAARDRVSGGLPTLGSGAQAFCRAGGTSQRANTAIAFGDFGTGGVRSAVAAFGAAGGTNFGFCIWDPTRATSNTFQPKEVNDVGPLPPDDSNGVGNLFISKQSSLTYVTYSAHFTGADAGVFVVRREPTSAASDFAGDPKVFFSATQRSNGVVPATTADNGGTMRTALSSGTGASGLHKSSLVARDMSLLTTSATGKAVTDSMQNLWVWGDGDLQMINPSNQVIAQLSSLSGFPSTIGSPVLAGRRAMDGGVAPDRVYLVSSTAEIGVAPQSGVTSAPWRAPLPVSGSVSASPAFDCNRIAPADAGSETGILYVVTNQGHVLSIIVDSPLLDRSAKWPKFQKDQFNSGNTSLNLDDGCR